MKLKLGKLVSLDVRTFTDFADGDDIVQRAAITVALSAYRRWVETEGLVLYREPVARIQQTIVKGKIDVVVRALVLPKGAKPHARKPAAGSTASHGPGRKKSIRSSQERLFRDEL